jgi:hypothetical protein
MERKIVCLIAALVPLEKGITMRVFASGLFLGLLFAVHAQVSPYTGKAVVPPDSAGHYRMLIGGHFHGASTNGSGYPAATVLAGLDTINGVRANLLLSTGDLFLDPDRDSLRYATSLFAKLDVALFNAPGNHDVEGRAARNHAQFPLTIAMGPDRIVLLDTERNNSDILGDQLAVLKNLADSTVVGGITRIFIVSHRPVWAEDDARYGRLFQGNTRSITGSNFGRDVLPLLRRMATVAEVFWISGSMAGRAPASIFFQPHEANITYIQCAVRDQLRDALLLVEATPDHLAWSAVSLTGTSTGPVVTYNADWWEANQSREEPFNWRRLPYLIRKNLAYPSFWYGAIASVLFMAPILLFLFRRKRME